MQAMENNLAFLFMDTARLFRKKFAEAARSFGGTGPQWRALLVLEKNPGINQGMLAEHLDVEPITACRMVDRLEQAGLVERRRDPADRRVWQLFVTESAAPVVGNLRAVGGGLIERAASALSPEEAESLKVMITRVRDNLASMEDGMEIDEAANG